LLYSRIKYVAALAFIVILGLASRKFHLFPAVLGKYPGDALWAIMVFYLVLCFKPSFQIKKAASFAFLISALDEFSQIYHSPALDHFRSTTIGHLILGSQFSWMDIIAYLIGILIVYGFHSIINLPKRQ